MGYTTFIKSISFKKLKKKKILVECLTQAYIKNQKSILRFTMKTIKCHLNHTCNSVVSGQFTLKVLVFLVYVKTKIDGVLTIDFIEYKNLDGVLVFVERKL